MLTRCPSCATAFRITPEQLKARQGRVRCGQCQHVFNALETLVEEARVHGSAKAPTSSAVDAAAIADQAAPPAAVSPAPTLEPQPEEIAAAEPASAAATPTAPMPQPEAGDMPPGPGQAETLVDYEPTFDTLLPEAPPRRAWPWVIGTLLALLALALQGVHHYRIELVVVAPETRPALEAFCDIAGCDLPLPRKIQLVGIETSDLHPAANAAQLQLSATLKNRAPFVQDYPHLELTLTDTADKAVLRRVLTPADYLPKDKPAVAGFAAAGDLVLNLTLEARDVAPVGYRLYVFYP